MQTVIVKQGQSILDIAIIYTGTLDTCFEIAVLNQMSISDFLTVGRILSVPDMINKKTTGLFTYKNQPATDLTQIDEKNITYKTGIGHMVVEQNFKVE